MLVLKKLSIPKVVYVDMDDTINYYSKQMLRKLRQFPNSTYPQSEHGFYLDIEPNLDGLESLRLLRDANYDVCIATRPSYKNLHCYTEKAQWIEKHLGEDWVPKLYLAPNKARLIGDFLIDDYEWPNFIGEMVVYKGDWLQVLKTIKDNEV